MPEPSARDSARSNNRLDTVRDMAAELFAAKGYHQTTMRDIAGRAGMLPGSIYYHFPSKEDLLVAVYEEGVARLAARVEAADPGAEAGPWARLEAVMTAHVAALLDDSAYASVLTRVLPDEAPGAEVQLVALRDAYEGRIATLVAALPLGPGTDPGLLRLFLLGAANHVRVWHRPATTGGGLDAAGIAAALIRLLRDPAGG